MLALGVVAAAAAAQAARGTCVGHCGGYTDTCWCSDSKCPGGDAQWPCCSDWAATCGGADPNSCAGHCGGYTDKCWCEASKCPGGDESWPCCSDYAAQCGGPGPAPGPTPTPAQRLTLHSFGGSFPEARCLDGSAAGYYLRKASGASENYIFFFQGGGWCYDQKCNATYAGTIADCQKRSTGSLGSSKAWREIMNDPGGLMSSSAAANPTFHDWNAVYVPYCDGTSWSGDLDGPVEAWARGAYSRGKVRGERRPRKPANAIAPC